MDQENTAGDEDLWSDLSQVLLDTAVDNRISPLDILIHVIGQVNFDTKDTEFIDRLYRWFQRARLRLFASFQDRPVWKPGTVFMLPVEPTHVDQMIPVAEALDRQDIPVMFLTTRIGIYKVLRSRGMPNFLLKGSSRGVADQIFVPLTDLFRSCPKPLLNRIRAYLSRHYSDVVAIANELLAVIDSAAPKYIFVGNDLTWEGRLLARLARRSNCKTGMIQHGLLGRETVNRYHIVDDFFVYGPAFKSILEEDGLTGVNVVVSGAPYLDYQTDQGFDYPHPEIKKYLQLKGRFVLITLSGVGHRTSADNYRLTLEWIDRLVRSHPDLEFVIKLHRKERIESYAMFSTHQKLRIIDRKRGRRLPQNIFDWLRGCSCLITGTSTVAYEAMLCNIPVISIDPLRQFKGVDFIDQRAVEVVHSYEGLEASLRRVNGQRGTADEFIKRIFWRSAIPAREQIARAIVNSALTESAGLSR